MAEPTRRTVMSLAVSAAAQTAPYDVAVIGAGVFGAWTAHHLRRAGKRVVLIDGFGAANSRASSAPRSPGSAYAGEIESSARALVRTIVFMLRDL